MCPKCGRHGRMTFHQKKKNGKLFFKCMNCQKITSASHDLPTPNTYADFTCPKCLTHGRMIGASKHTDGVQKFKCTNCHRGTLGSCSLYNRRKYEDFICPKCGEIGSMIFGGQKEGKKAFRCQKCNQITVSSCTLQKSTQLLTLKPPKPTTPFDFDADIWDTRALIELDKLSYSSSSLNFSKLEIEFLKLPCKRYVLHCLRTGVSLNTLKLFVRVASSFSDYLGMNYNITSMEELTRDMVLGFMAECSPHFSSETIRHYLSSLRGFFDTGNLLGWFNVSEHLIRTEDYPKAKRGTPNDIPTVVLNQIEENLHQLPDTIARMWLVGFFCAMRISELQLCKLDCLKQDSRGQWFIEFWRKKNKEWLRYAKGQGQQGKG